MKFPRFDFIRQVPRARLVVGGAVAAGLAVLVIGAVVLLSRSGDTAGGSPSVQGGGGSTPAATETPPPTATSEAVLGGYVTPEPAGSGSAGGTLTTGDLASRGSGEPGRGAFRGTRITIPAIGVDAPFTVRTVGDDGKMPNPKGPTDVVWYDFSNYPGLGGSPGFGGNSVFSGHVDYVDYGPAVFWSLKDLKPGDEVNVALDDGSTIRYAVQWTKITVSATADWDSIVRATQQESATLITCTGQFDSATRQYDQRVIVWATRE